MKAAFTNPLIAAPLASFVHNHVKYRTLKWTLISFLINHDVHHYELLAVPGLHVSDVLCLKCLLHLGLPFLIWWVDTLTYPSREKTSTA
jgi:hypothetical protein